MKRILFFVILLFIGGAFYMMNSYEPLRCDDLIYQFYWLDDYSNELVEPIDLNNRIDDVFEAFSSQINHYFVMNGRFTVHFIVSCFCGFGGRLLFSILNTLVYVLFLIECVKLLNLNSITKSVSAVILVWLVLPIQYILWYSVAFAVNYLWVSAAFIFFFIIFENHIVYDKNNSVVNLAGLFLFGFVFGSMHEGFSLPLSAAMLSFIVLNRITISKKYLFLAVGLWLGTAIVVLAPSTIGRGAGSLSGISPSDMLLMKLDVLRYSKRLYFFLILLTISFVLDRNGFYLFVKRKQLAIYFIIFDFCFVMSVPHYSQRIEFPLELLSLILSLDLVFNYRCIEKHKAYLCSFLILLLLIHVPLTVYYAKITSKEYTEMLNTYLDSPNGVTHYKNITVPKFFSSYIHRLDEGVEKDYISFVYHKEMHIEE